MSMAHLGPSFDVHTGGVDLVFPHHEDEIAQSEAATGKPFVRTWLHCAHLRMGGEKMAKSTGNIARVGELIDAGTSPRALRYALISVHYRASLNFSDESLAAAGGRRRPDRRPADRARGVPRGPRGRPRRCPASSTGSASGFEAALDDDLNVSAALARAVRRGARAQPAPRRAAAVDGRRGPGDGAASATWTRCSGSRRPRRPRWSRGSRRCWTSGSRRGRRATGPPPTGSATSCSRAGSRSRTPATGSAGDRWWPPVADRRDPGDEGRPPKSRRSAPRGGGPGSDRRRIGAGPVARRPAGGAPRGPRGPRPGGPDPRGGGGDRGGFGFRDEGRGPRPWDEGHGGGGRPPGGHRGAPRPGGDRGGGPGYPRRDGPPPWEDRSDRPRSPGPHGGQGYGSRPGGPPGGRPQRGGPGGPRPGGGGRGAPYRPGGTPYRARRTRRTWRTRRPGGYGPRGGAPYRSGDPGGPGPRGGAPYRPAPAVRGTAAPTTAGQMIADARPPADLAAPAARASDALGRASRPRPPHGAGPPDEPIVVDAPEPADPVRDTPADDRPPRGAYPAAGRHPGPDRRPYGDRRPYPDRRPYAGGGRPPDRGQRYTPRPVAPLDPSIALGEREELVAGRRPVEEAFVARREARRLLVVPQRRQALEKLVLHATSLRIPVVEVEGGTLTAVAGFDGHQGIALVVAPRRWASPDDVLALAAERGEPPLVLVLDSLEDPQNVGTLLRTAEATGAHGAVFPTRHQAPLTPAAVKASAGAVEHLRLAPVDDLPGALADLHARGLRIVGADGDAPLTARDADLRGPIAIVVGSEGKGLGRRFAAAATCWYGSRCTAGSTRSTPRWRARSCCTRPRPSGGSRSRRGPACGGPGRVRTGWRRPGARSRSDRSRPPPRPRPAGRSRRRDPRPRSEAKPAGQGSGAAEAAAPSTWRPVDGEPKAQAKPTAQAEPKAAATQSKAKPAADAATGRRPPADAAHARHARTRARDHEPGEARPPPRRPRPRPPPRGRAAADRRRARAKPKAPQRPRTSKTSAASAEGPPASPARFDAPPPRPRIIRRLAESYACLTMRACRRSSIGRAAVL